MIDSLAQQDPKRPDSPMLSGVTDDEIWDAISHLIRRYKAMGTAFGDDSAGHLEKGMYMTARNLGWHIGEFVNTSLPGKASILFEAVDAVIDAVIDPENEDDVKLGLHYRTPRGTNHGCPDYTNSDVSLVAHLIAGEAIRSGTLAIDDAWAQIQKAYETDIILPAHQTMFNRRQTNRKPVREWAFAGEDGELISTFEVTGRYPKVRHVNGVPTWLNTVMRPAFEEIKRRMRRYTWFKHGREQELNDTFWAGWKFDEVINLDASTFDQHVFRALRDRVRDRLLPLLKRFGATAALDAVTKSHILMPALYFGDEAFLADSEGIVTSGEVGTSIIDSIISCSLTMAALAIVWGMSPSAVLEEFISLKHNGKWQGDDTLVGASRKIDRDELTTACEDMGFPVKTSTAPIFLMTHLPGPGRKAHGLASRAFINSYFRERPQTSEAVELLGLEARLERCVADEGYSAVETELFANRWLRARGIDSLRSLKSFIRSSSFTALVEAEKIVREGSKHWHEARSWARGMLKGDNADDESTERGDAESDYDSRDLWRYLEALGADLKLDVMANELLTKFHAAERITFSQALELFHEMGRKKE